MCWIEDRTRLNEREEREIALMNEGRERSNCGGEDLKVKFFNSTKLLPWHFITVHRVITRIYLCGQITMGIGRIAPFWGLGPWTKNYFEKSLLQIPEWGGAVWRSGWSCSRLDELVLIEDRFFRSKIVLSDRRMREDREMRKGERER